jgi:TetR/AcrR family transcriptional repressor of mexJK operon
MPATRNDPNAKGPRRRSSAPHKAGTILVAARTLFLRHGYLGTSVDAIVREAGVSKATIYFHFKDKAQLFTAAMAGAQLDLSAALAGLLTPKDRDVGRILRRFGSQLLLFAAHPDSAKVIGAVIGVSRQFPDLGKQIYEVSNGLAVSLLANLFREWAGDGLLTMSNPTLAAKQFLFMIIGDAQLRSLLNAGERLTAADADASVDSAVAQFLRCYAGPATEHG